MWENPQQSWNYVHDFQEESRIPEIMKHNESDITDPQAIVYPIQYLMGVIKVIKIMIIFQALRTKSTILTENEVLKARLG